MRRLDKKKLISNLNDCFSSFDAFIVVHYKGLTVAQIEELRSKAFDLDVNFKIVKNSLASIAVKDTKNSVLEEFFVGPTAIAWGKNPVSCAKIVHEFAVTNSKLEIVGGSYNGLKIMSAEIVNLATLPSLDELRSKIVKLLVVSATKIAVLSKISASNIVGVLQSYSQQEK